jgi:hypothetical protein
VRILSMLGIDASVHGEHAANDSAQVGGGAASKSDVVSLVERHQLTLQGATAQLHRLVACSPSHQPQWPAAHHTSHGAQASCPQRQSQGLPYNIVTPPPLHYLPHKTRRQAPLNRHAWLSVLRPLRACRTCTHARHLWQLLPAVQGMHAARPASCGAQAVSADSCGHTAATQQPHSIPPASSREDAVRAGSLSHWMR